MALKIAHMLPFRPDFGLRDQPANELSRLESAHSCCVANVAYRSPPYDVEQSAPISLLPEEVSSPPVYLPIRS